MVCPAVDGSGLMLVMVVVDGRTKTVITSVSFRVTPPAFAVMVLSSATIELKVKVAFPSAFVVGDTGVMVLPVPLEVRVTGTPASTAPFASRTVTVIVLLAPVAMTLGAASIEDRDALGPAEGQLIWKAACAVCPAVTDTVFEGPPPTLQLPATPESTTVCDPGVTSVTV